MRISREHFGHRSGSASHTFLINSRRAPRGYLAQPRLRSVPEIGAIEKDLQIDRLREVAHRAFGSSFTRWFWSARVRIGVV